VQSRDLEAAILTLPAICDVYSGSSLPAQIVLRRMLIQPLNTQPVPDLKLNTPPPLREGFSGDGAAYTYCQTWAYEHGYALKIRTTKKNKRGRKQSIRLIYDKGRLYTQKGNGKRKTSTKLQDCPFASAPDRLKAPVLRLYSHSRLLAPCLFYSFDPSMYIKMYT
jgi:hypothetical protein